MERNQIPYASSVPTVHSFDNSGTITSLYDIANTFNACVCYFLFFHQMIPIENYHKGLFHRKTPFRSRDIHFFVIFSLSTLSWFKRTNESGRIMMSWIGLHKLADLISGITQKPPYITSSNLIKKFSWTCFITWRATSH